MKTEEYELLKALREKWCRVASRYDSYSCSGSAPDRAEYTAKAAATWEVVKDLELTLRAEDIARAAFESAKAAAMEALEAGYKKPSTSG